ncbi:low-density lipoprotein receptor-related protein 12-like [Branchiostoma floridae]|uniref:Low-density lipoprotein receptor-related protein 12-like n=1 Tax=Branchiostoma floridae TaxID=7739 RepID=C3ZMH2_BRAFL|nr:low-density lipoprotein receptor-related protein 12-like [Branchiostoma floridae]|eukprot:XP_002590256.1 hypothetical protein BRAFLDRAFT_132336 [Branchiostoma floridae]
MMLISTTIFATCLLAAGHAADYPTVYMSAHENQAVSVSRAGYIEWHERFQYQDDTDVTLTLQAGTGNNVRLDFLSLNIEGSPGACVDKLEVYDGEGTPVENSTRTVCGTNVAVAAFTSRTENVVLRLRSDNMVRGDFRILYNVFRLVGPNEMCPRDHFKCTNQRCIHESLLCDGIDNCGDNSEESQAACVDPELTPVNVTMKNTCGRTLPIGHSGYIYRGDSSQDKVHINTTTVSDRRRDCHVTLDAPAGYHVNLHFEFLDIQRNFPFNCADQLHIFNGRHGNVTTAARTVCGIDERDFTSTGSDVTLHISSAFGRRGSFRIMYTLFRPSSGSCYNYEFLCQSDRRCVLSDVTCDGKDNCGDASDETTGAGCTERAGGSGLGVAGIVGICLAGAALLFILGGLMVYFSGAIKGRITACLTTSQTSYDPK